MKLDGDGFDNDFRNQKLFDFYFGFNFDEFFDLHLAQNQIQK